MIGASDGVRLPSVSSFGGRPPLGECEKSGECEGMKEEWWLGATLLVLYSDPFCFTPVLYAIVLVCRCRVFSLTADITSMPCHVNAVNETLTDGDCQQGRGFDWSTVTRMNAFQWEITWVCISLSGCPTAVRVYARGCCTTIMIVRLLGTLITEQTSLVGVYISVIAYMTVIALRCVRKTLIKPKGIGSALGPTVDWIDLYLFERIQKRRYVRVCVYGPLGLGIHIQLHRRRSCVK